MSGTAYYHTRRARPKMIIYGASMPETIDIVLPVHNEGDTIARTLREFHRRVAIEEGRSVRFVVCEDGSTDGTVAVLEALKAELPILLLRSEERKGYPRAVLDGLRASRGEVVVVADSDGQCDPADFARLLEAVEGVDLAAGVRRPRADPWARRLMSGAFGLAHRALFGAPLSDPSCPFVAVRRGLLDRLLAGPFGFLPHGFWWEFTARAAAAGARIRETPIHHRPRASGATRVFRPADVPVIACLNLAGLARLAWQLGASAGRPPVWMFGVAALFLFWPALGQPLMLDDIDIPAICAIWQPDGFAAVAWKLLDRCMLPFYFRPLTAPVFMLWHYLGGDNPLYLRLVMLAVQVATAAVIFRLVQEAIEDDLAAFFAAAFFALSWIHWDTLWNVANVCQSASDLLFWMALRAVLRPGAAAGGPLLAASAALLFKESAILFAPFALAGEVLLRGRAPSLVRRALLYGAWAAAYLGARVFLLPERTMPVTPLFPWEWPGARILGMYRAAGEYLVSPLLRPIPRGFFDCAWDAGGRGALDAFVWTTAVAALAIWLGWAGWKAASAARDAAGSRRVAGLFVFGVFGFFAGLVPYLFLRGMLAWGWVHRLSVSGASLALCFGIAAAWLARAAARRDRRAAAAVCFALMGALFVGSALRIRRQDPRLHTFDGAKIGRETSRTSRFLREHLAPGLRDHERVAFDGFPANLRSPVLFLFREGIRMVAVEAGDPYADWHVRRRESAEGVELGLRRSGGPETTVSWKHPTRCDPNRGWDFAEPY